MATKKPNILIIWGDDIGWFNISAYNHGMMGYRTPNIDRIAKEGAMFTDWYGQQSCTAGRAAFITGQSPIRTGLTKVGLPGLEARSPAGGSDDRRAAQAAGLRLRPVRQEPSRRPRRVPADRTRLRRVLRQPLSPQRRRGTGVRGLPEGRRLREEVRTARRAALLREPGRHAADRGHRPPDQEAHGDDGRGDHGGCAGLHRGAGQGGQAVLLLVQLHQDARLDASEGRGQGQDGARRVPRRHGRARPPGRGSSSTSSTS